MKLDTIILAVVFTLMAVMAHACGSFAGCTGSSNIPGYLTNPYSVTSAYYNGAWHYNVPPMSLIVIRR